MTKIYLIRHAEAEGNLYRIVQGHIDSRITALGEKQLDALAERFRNIQLDALYSSDLTRAFRTAQAAARYRSLEIVRDPRLREICLGICEGMSFGDMRHMDPVQMDYFNNDPEKWRAEGAETFEQCRERVYSALCDIAESNDGRTVGVVSHGFAIRSVLSKLLGVPSNELRERLPHGDNTSVTVLRYENGGFTVELCNDNSHLPEELSTFAKQTWWRVESGGRDENNLRYELMDPYTDGKLFTECYAQSWLAAHGDLKAFEPELYLADARRCRDADKNSLLALYSEDDFAGLLALDTERGRSRGFGWISLIYLREEYRGRGLGIQPLGKAIVYFRQLGRKSVRLHVSELNKRAIAFYKKYGFEVIGSSAGCGAPLLLMEFRL